MTSLSPKSIEISYTRVKVDQDIRLLNWKDIPVSDIKDQQVIRFAPGMVGGNHKHPRTEWYLAFGDLVLYWLNDTGEVQNMHLNPEGKLLLVTIPPFLPHAVLNVSQDQFGILLELADAKQENVERVWVYPKI